MASVPLNVKRYFAKRLCVSRKRYLLPASILLYLLSTALHADEQDDKGWYLIGEPLSDIHTSTLEYELDRFLSHQPTGLLLPLHKYTFQYKFLTESKVEIHGLCMEISDKEYLTRGFIMVSDGGNCFFTIEFDSEKLTFDKLRINGIA